MIVWSSIRLLQVDTRHQEGLQSIFSHLHEYHNSSDPKEFERELGW